MPGEMKIVWWGLPGRREKDGEEDGEGRAKNIQDRPRLEVQTQAQSQSHTHRVMVRLMDNGSYDFSSFSNFGLILVCLRHDRGVP